MPTPSSTEVRLDDLRLVDHHCHGVVAGDLARPDFEALMNESDWPAGAGLTWFDSQVGLAIRRHCAPALGLPAGATAEEYLARRAELGGAEATRRLLRAARLDALLLETGYRGDDILGPDAMAAVAGARTFEVVRLERVAEELLAGGVAPDEFADRFAAALAEASAVGAVAWKSIAAYRVGLDFDPERPSAAEVTDAVTAWRAEAHRTGGVRLGDPTIIRALLWAAVDTGMPLQFHVGYGDADVQLHWCNPLLMTRWLHLTRETGARVLLLHCYPYHREAGYLAQVFPHVYCDVGLAINNTGARAAALIAESLELAPFHKVLFSTDAFGLPELYLTGATLFRRGLAETLRAWVARGECDGADAVRIADLVGHRNATRVYGLNDRK